MKRSQFKGLLAVAAVGASIIGLIFSRWLVLITNVNVKVPTLVVALIVLTCALPLLRWMIWRLG